MPYVFFSLSFDTSRKDNLPHFNTIPTLYSMMHGFRSKAHLYEGKPSLQKKKHDLIKSSLGNFTVRLNPRMYSLSV